jgi:hypothetical protein
MPRWVMPRCDGETDLVVELRRCRNVAFLLDMESHAGGTGLNAATIRSELLGDNWGCVLEGFAGGCGLGEPQAQYLCTVI